VERVSHVLPEILNQANAGNVACGLLVPFETTERDMRAPQRFLSAKSGTDKVVGFHQEMQTHLLIHLAINVGFEEEGAKTSARHVKPVHTLRLD
jgi:hypothetical protein